MPTWFHNPTLNYILITNQKVMTTTLRAQENLTKIGEFSAWKQHREQGARCYVLVRSPYERLVSCYTNKVKEKATQAYMADRQPIDAFQIPSVKYQWFDWLLVWQMRLLGSNASERTRALLRLTFADFIAFLPAIYSRDYHLSPQSWACGWGRSKLGLVLGAAWAARLGTSVKFDRIIRLEEMDGRWVLEELGIDTSIVKRPSIHQSAAALFTPESYAVVNHLYRGDFQRFGYPMQTG